VPSADRLPSNTSPSIKGSLQKGLVGVAILTESADNHCRLLGVLREQQGRYAIQRVEHTGEPGAVEAFQRLLDQGILSHFHFDILVETDPAKLADLSHSQRLRIGDVEVIIFLELVFQQLNDFIFFDLCS